MARQTLQIAQNEGMERLVVSGVSRVAVLVPPWAVLWALLIVGTISHAMWGEPPAVTWVAMVSTLLTTVLTLLTWAVSHQRGPLGRWHSTLTTGSAGLWFTIVTITGPGLRHPGVTLAAWFFGGGALALGWNIRAVIRQGNVEDGPGDPLAAVFDKAKASFGLGGARVTTKEVTDHKIKATLALPPGEKTPKDTIKKLDNIEGGLRFPPGAVQLSPDETDASKMHMTVANPLVMKRPIPWAGAYAPGRSIAEAIRVGMWQDMDPVLHAIVGHHLQIMGMSGSGKSIGGAWNYLGEIMTRYDVAILAADLSKDDQTLGPLDVSLHRFEKTKSGVVALIHGLRREIPERTKWLAAHGYQKWVEGCGLTYWVVLLEEVAKIFGQLSDKDEELLLEIVKEIRSAGGTVIMSLQRADYSQMPTLARGQLAKMCFGVAEESDADFGLSATQKNAECDPAMWANKQPGMAYLDAPSIPETHVTMPLRTYAWGKDDREANAAMRAHAQEWPATAKVVDPFTARISDPAKVGQVMERIPVPAGVGAGGGGGTAVLDRPRTGGGGGGHDDGPAEPVQQGEDPKWLELLGMAAELVITTQLASTAMLQRKLRLPHEECLRLMEALERKGIIGPDPGDPEVKRQVLVNTDDLEEATRVVEQLKDDGDPVGEYLRTEDPDPSITAGPDDEVVAPTAEEAERLVVEDDAPAERMSPAAARRLVHDWVRHRAQAGSASFTASDDELVKIRERAGMSSRGWIYARIDELVSAGVLDETKEGGQRRFTIVDVGALDRLQDGAW